ncbi:hypothetical protein A9A89_0508 [Bifidobacterium psychraerophilum DSM 22366]|nr:hypothetical protein A9A89_0508 [Bifidobacterium psychraerophilum DSM 22366]
MSRKCHITPIHIAKILERFVDIAAKAPIFTLTQQILHTQHYQQESRTS